MRVYEGLDSVLSTEYRVLSFFGAPRVSSRNLFRCLDFDFDLDFDLDFDEG